MGDQDERTRNISQRNTQLARGQLSALHEGQRGRRRRRRQFDLGRAQGDVQESGTEALARPHGRQGLDRADLAQGIRRRRPVAGRGPRARRRSWPPEALRPPLLSFGIWMLGPVLLEYATEEQKQRAPARRSCAARSAGARAIPSRARAPTSPALHTQCEDKGDHWLINGQKIWTCYADKADWCFCLVRTDTTKKHEGISFVLIDMTSPGVETRPIKLITGESPFCETFFTDVKMPKEQPGRQAQRRLGDRQAAPAVRAPEHLGRRLRRRRRRRLAISSDAAKTMSGEDDGRLADARPASADHDAQDGSPGLRDDGAPRRRRVASRQGAVGGHLDHQVRGGEGRPGALRADGRGDGHAGPRLGGRRLQPGEVAAMRGWLRAKGNSIEGGTSEINLNVVSKRVLGLPDHQ